MPILNKPASIFSCIVLHLCKATQSIVNKIVLLQTENAKLENRLAAQEAHLADQRTQSACLNDTLLKLEEHLRTARQGLHLSI